MFDMHVHQQMRSKFLGDRQGRVSLPYRVTSTRSTGDQVYRALEDRESPPNPDWSRATVQDFARLLRAGATVMMGTDAP